MKKMILVMMVVLAGLATGCSVTTPVFGPNEIVVSDDGDVIITSEITVYNSTESEGKVAQTMTVANDANVWRISQNLLRYYRQGGTLYMGGQLVVEVGVKNIAYQKIVGMRYTENNWNNWQDADGSWSQYYSQSNTDRFTIYSHSSIAPGALVEYALYYKVDGQEFWDNNGGANYTAQF